MTFSVVAFDPKREEWGVAVASRYLSVGSVVPWALQGTGCVATQAMANYSYGPRGLELLRNMNADEVIENLISSDPDREHRQVGVVDSKGNAAAHTGSKCMNFAGHLVGKNFSVQGNILAGREVLDAMYSEMNKGYPLEERLINCLMAGEKAGGDRRGKQSAAMLVTSSKREFEPDSGKFMEIRVEDHVDPVNELSRIRDIWMLMFADSDTVNVSDYSNLIEKKLKSLNYKTLEEWAGINNLEHNLKDGRIGKRTLSLLLEMGES